MDSDPEIRIVIGFEPRHRHAAAHLYWDAFGLKLEHAIGPRSEGVSLIERTLAPDRAIAAFQGDILVGLAGFHLDGRALTAIKAGDIVRQFGLLRSLRRLMWAAALERSPAPDELLMDGVVVRADRRGHGVGTQLMLRMFDLALEHQKRVVRLDVVDTNPAARRLYQRLGFVEVRTERVPFLRRAMGFSAATTMERAVS